MQVIAFKVGTLRDMAEGTIDADADVFAEYGGRRRGCRRQWSWRDSRG